MSKAVIVYHRVDLDGVCSGILAYKDAIISGFNHEDIHHDLLRYLE